MALYFILYAKNHNYDKRCVNDITLAKKLISDDQNKPYLRHYLHILICLQYFENTTKLQNYGEHFIFFILFQREIIFCTIFILATPYTEGWIQHTADQGHRKDALPRYRLSADRNGTATGCSF